jgi:N-acetylglutamate synthase-like GNAT family acetyltransferase
MGYTVERDNYLISTDKNKIDLEYIHSFLTQSYWSPGISVELVKKAMENSLSFGMYESDEKAPAALKQIGYARMVTDEATFAYLADVFIDENYRGKGLGKWLVDTIMAHPSLQGLRKILLVTKYAQKLYEQCGFTVVHNPGGHMVYNPQKA